MATTKGTAIAAPQIFTSDPLEQGFAKGLTDPDMGGLSYAFFNAARSDRSRQQDTYMQALRESNMMASRLAQHEADQELLGKYLTSSAEMANAGIDPSTMPISARLYSNPMDPLVRQPSELSRDKKRAEAEHLRAQSAAAGQAGADTTTYTQDIGPGGVQGDVRVVTKSRDPNRARTVNQQAVGTPGPGSNVRRPDGTYGPPTTAEIRAQTRDAALITQRLNDKDAKYRDR